MCATEAAARGEADSAPWSKDMQVAARAAKADTRPPLDGAASTCTAAVGRGVAVRDVELVSRVAQSADLDPTKLTAPVCPMR